MKRSCSVLLIALAVVAARGEAQGGRELIEESLRRHAPPPYVYEEQALVLSDSLDQHTVRTAKYYAQRDASGQRRLLVIGTPAESRGARVFVGRDAQGGTRRGTDASSPLFGSDFTVADFEGEQTRNFRYELESDQDLERVPHRVLRALPLDESIARETGYGERRIYLRKDNLFITRIDYLNRQGRLTRRQTFRDPRPDESGAWRAGMVLMENLRDGRRTLLKIERRVHSQDYVPAAIFAGMR